MENKKTKIEKGYCENCESEFDGEYFYFDDVKVCEDCFNKTILQCEQERELYEERILELDEGDI